MLPGRLSGFDQNVLGADSGIIVKNNIYSDIKKKIPFPGGVVSFFVKIFNGLAWAGSFLCIEENIMMS